MRHSFIAAAVLLGSAFAVPHEKHYPRPGGHHGGPHHYYPTGTSAPLVTGTGTGTVTGTAAPSDIYETSYETSTFPLNEDHGSSALPLESSPESSPPLADKHAEKPANDCNANTVTVTTQATVTVTVSSGGSSSASPSQVGPAALIPHTSAGQPSPSASILAEESTPEGGDDEADSDDDQNEESSDDSSNDSSNAGSTSPSSTTEEKASEPAPSPAVEAQSASAPSPSSSSPSTSDEDTDDTSKSTSPAPAAAGTSPFKSKRGIIASGDSMNALAGAFGNTKVSWLGNWYSAPPKTIASSLTFVPQNYGKQSDTTGEWTRNAQQAVSKGSKYFLSFGEPGTPNDKLHLEPSEAVQLWKDKMEPYAKQGVTLGAPGTLQNTQDFDWLSKFLDACADCSIGFIAMHWFDKAGAAQVPGFKETLQKAKVIADKRGVPVWLDNFSAKGGEKEQREFLGEVVPWLDAQEWIQAYAYVPPEVGKAGDGANMVGGDGKLNALGQYYANL